MTEDSISAIAAVVQDGEPAVAQSAEALESAVEVASASLRLTSPADWSVLTAFASRLSAPSTPWVAEAAEAISQRMLKDVAGSHLRQLSEHFRRQTARNTAIRAQVALVGQQLQEMARVSLQQLWQATLRTDWSALLAPLARLEPSDKLHLRLALYKAGLALAPSMGEELRERLVSLHRSDAGSSQLSNAASRSSALCRGDRDNNGTERSAKASVDAERIAVADVQSGSILVPRKGQMSEDDFDELSTCT